MSGRSSRLGGAGPDPDADPKARRRLLLGRLHDAAQIGDVASVRELFESGDNDLHARVARRGGNTALHTALLHGVDGPLIDYLIGSGAEIDRENSKGQSPLALAIAHCRGSRAAEKLIAAGARREAIGSGAFEGMSAMDVALKYDNESVVQYLKDLLEGGICREVSAADRKPGRGRAICPVCNAEVKFPTKMSRIAQDQLALEERLEREGTIEATGGRRQRHRKYISRKYMDQLLRHSNGDAYRRLCGIEFHGVENMRLRKEISESYGVLHAVRSCCERLGAGNGGGSGGDVPLGGGDVRFENLFMIDLCSGKGITAALCGALDGDAANSNNYFLAVDRLLRHQVPHFLDDEKVRYLCRDVMADDTLDELADIVADQTEGAGRTCVLVGMHLCGLLSERAIDLFERAPGIRGLVLSPCCLPKRHEQNTCMTKFRKERPPEGGRGEGGTTADLYNYNRWSRHLKDRMGGLGGVADTSIYADEEMHTEKNTIIVACKTSA